MGEDKGDSAVVAKMKSQSGAAIFLALMFFLICALAGSAILAIARSYEKRSAARVKEEAEYLAALSAMEFLEEQLRSCEGERSLDESGVNIEEEEENEVQKELLEIMLRFCEEYMDNPGKAGEEIDLTISLEDDPDETWRVPDAKVHVVFEADDEEAEAGLEEVLEEEALEEEASEEEAEEESEEFFISLRMRAVISIEERKNRIMSLSASAVISYKPEELMELYWESFEVGK